MFHWLKSTDHADSENRTTFIPLVLLGAVASLVGYFSNKDHNLIEQIFYPLIFIISIASSVLLGFRQISVSKIRLLFLVILTIYQIGELILYTKTGLLFSAGFSSTVIWASLIYPLSFLFLPHKLALQYSWVYFALMATIGLGGYLAAPSVNLTAVNTVIQFYLASLAYLIIETINSRYRKGFLEMSEIANTDSLTGLRNRRNMYQYLEAEYNRSRRSGNTFAVFVMDVDHFKKVNDEFGHARGDQALVNLARLLEEVLRSYDLLARWGGEEFLVLAPDTTFVEAKELAHRIVTSVSNRTLLENIPLTISAGFTVNRPSDTIDTIISRADKALYKAKTKGRNRYEWMDDFLDGTDKGGSKKTKTKYLLPQNPLWKKIKPHVKD